MLAGERVQVNTGTFSNDMTNFQGKDDVLTLLIHLGYLSYHWPDKTVTIPNKEVSQEYINAISTMKWSEVTASVEASKILLEALWNLDEKAVAEGTQEVVDEVESQIEDGSLHVFDTATWTVDGKTLDTYEKNGIEYISDGYFHESEYGSAPAFDIIIDGIDSIVE